MKRPLLIIALAFMSGIILKSNIIWTVIIITALFLLCGKNNKNFNIFLIIVISMILGSAYISAYNFFKLNQVKYYNDKSIELIGTVSKQTNLNSYVLKNVSIKNIKISSNVKITTKEKLEYGDKIKASIDVKIPNIARNSGGFNYQQYLKTQNIYLIGKTKEINIIEKNQLSIIENLSEKIRNQVRIFTQNTLDKEEAGILQALIIGDDSKIEEELQEKYKKAGMIHLLVVSGGHTAFLILLISFILKKVKASHNSSKYILIISIIMYVFITGASSSVLRAGIAAIIIIIGDLIGRQNDTLTTIGLVAFILVIANPNIIYSLSFQLSFLGAIGIILAYTKIERILEFLPKIIREAVALTLSAQLFVTPVTLYNFNTIYLGGIISNVFSMSLAGIIMMAGMIIFPIYLLIPSLGNILMLPVKFMIYLMNLIANIFSSIPFFNYTLTTPSLLQISIYYLTILYILDIDYSILIERENRVVDLPVLCTESRHKKAKLLICGVTSILIVTIITNIIPKPLEIAVIDVGHGDSILITTPNRKALLIDTGDKYISNGKEVNSGKQTVVPYLLDKGYKTIDLLILSHLDSDHIGGFEEIMKTLNVKNVGVSINSNKKEKYSDIEQIINREKTKRIYLEQGKTLIFDGIKLKILSPKKTEKVEEENNDSVVVLMEYQGKKALFMGDLEASEEEKILKNNELDVDILKIGHHGSITSTTEELVKETTPNIALISVGTRFSSIPSKVVLNRLGSVHSKVYRTDIMGEIVVRIDKGKMYVKTTY